MKKKLLYGLCCAALFVGCTQDLNEVIAPEGEQLPIQLFSSINQTTASRVNDEGFCNNDGIGIYVVNYQNGAPGTMLSEGNQVDNVRYVYNESENKWTPDYPVYYYDKVTPVDIVGYYPYVSKIDNVNTYSFEVAKDQSTDAANGLMGGYEASDFLWGKAENISPTASRVNITFNHKMAGVQVELTEGTGWAENEWVGLDKQVLVSNTIRKATIDLANGDITPVGDVPTTGTVPAKSGDGWRAVVVPQSVGASVALLNITVDGTSYVYRKNSAYEYLSGKLHKFTIEVSKKSESGLTFKLVGEAITAWESETITHDGTAREYVVINVPVALTNSSALKAAIEASGKDYTKIKNLKVIGEVSAKDFCFMRDEMTLLQGVNMQECRIVAGHADLGAYSAADVIPEKAFYNKKTLTYFVFPKGVTTINSNAFRYTNLTGALIIPEGVKTIGKVNDTLSGGAFAYCSGLTSLSLPSTLEFIGGQTFDNCTSLSGVLSIPSTVKIIGQYAFTSCSGFTGNLNLPENLEYLGNCAFQHCRGLSGSLTIPEKITAIGDSTFQNCGFDGVLKLPRNLLTIDKSAFYGCSFQGVLELPEGLISIGGGAFCNNKFSGELRLPSTLTQIGQEAFMGCNRITGVVEIPEEILVLANSIFKNCSQLEGCVLPSGLEQIQANAFENCYQLNSITCKAKTPPTVTSTAFNGVAKDNFTVEVPEASVMEYTTAPVWREFKRIAAHRDFSISRNLFRTLNDSDNKKLVLRAEADASHFDHYRAFVDVLYAKGNSGLIRMDYLLGNFPPESAMYAVAWETTYMGREGTIDTLKDKINGGFSYIKVHTGQKFYFANLSIEILMTFEEHFPRRICNSNDTCTVTRFEFANADAPQKEPVTAVFLADAFRYQSRFLCATYGEYLKADIVQVAHHGNIGCEQEIYELIAPSVVYFPNGYDSYITYTLDANSTRGWNYAVDNFVVHKLESVHYIFVADRWFVTLPLDKDGLCFDEIYDALTGERLTYSGATLIQK